MFWKQVKGLQDQYIGKQEELSGNTYFTDLKFTAELDLLWDEYVKFAVDSKPNERTIVEWALIMCRAKELANYDNKIDLESYQNIYYFINKNLMSYVAA